MKRVPNPFKKDFRYRLELAFDLVPENIKSLLDYGCSDGTFLFAIKNKIPASKLYGYEVDKKRAETLSFKRNNIKIIKVRKVMT